jgi:hypothetical protein
MAFKNLDGADLKRVKAGGLIREDVMNKIFDISRIPLPFTDMIGTDTAKNEYVEWTQDSLQKPDVTNALVDGQDMTGNNAAVGARVGNHHQISGKVVQVSYRADASDTIGRSKELSYQIMRRQQELRRDVEAIALMNQGSVFDNGGKIAGKVGGLPTWLETNYVGRGKPGGFNNMTKTTHPVVLHTNDTALSEEDLREAIESVYMQGGNPSVMMAVPRVISSFSQYMIKSKGATAQIHTEADARSEAPVTALGVVNVFVTDFGTIKAVPNRLQPMHRIRYLDATYIPPIPGAANPPIKITSERSSFVFILDPSYLSMCYLRGYQSEPLAKTGLSEKQMMSVDWSLIVHTEKAHALIGDVDPDLAMKELN